MKNLKMKLKGNLRDQIENESKKGKNDTRLLNYYDLKEGEKMKVLLVPDVNGELWAKFKKHGPNLRLPGAGSINCAYTSSGDNCPACQKGFDLLNLAKETGNEEYKKEAKRWFARDYTLVSCIVLESPMEIQESPDHNQIKLMYLPYKIETMIKEAVTEGQVEQEEIPFTPLVIKKTKNPGGYASYDHSFFDRKMVDDDDLEYLEDMVVEQFDYNDLDLIPAASTTAKVEEWLEKAEEVDAKAQNGESSGGSSEGSTGDSAPKAKSSVADRLKSKKKPVEDNVKYDPDEDLPESFDEPAEEAQEEPEEEEEQQEEESKPSAGSSALRDRLKKMRR
jgi:hypothetical protein